MSVVWKTYRVGPNEGPCERAGDIVDEADLDLFLLRERRERKCGDRKTASAVNSICVRESVRLGWEPGAVVAGFDALRLSVAATLSGFLNRR